jgi:hypothetical protein
VVKRLPGQLKIMIAVAGLTLVLAGCKHGRAAPFIPTSTLQPVNSTMPTPTLPQAQAMLREGSTATCSPTRTNVVTPSLGLTGTRIQTATRGPTVTHTTQPTAAQTPVFSIPDVLNPLYPTGMPSDYRLRPWSETYCAALVDMLVNRNFNVSPPIDDVSPYALALQAECLLRYPQSTDHEKMLQNMVDIDPAGFPLPSMRSGESLFAYMVEDFYARGII